jgi:hypothetical protein
MEVGGQSHASSDLLWERDRVFYFTEAWSGRRGRSGRVGKTSPPSGFEPRAAEPLESRYTDYAFPNAFQR